MGKDCDDKPGCCDGLCSGVRAATMKWGGLLLKAAGGGKQRSMAWTLQGDPSLRSLSYYRWLVFLSAHLRTLVLAQAALSALVNLQNGAEEDQDDTAAKELTALLARTGRSTDGGSRISGIGRMSNAKGRGWSFSRTS